MTRNHEFNTPSKGDQDWHIPVNDNFNAMDTAIEVRDQESNRSDYEPKAGAKFFAIDTEAIYIGDGSKWQRVASSGDRLLAAPNGQIVPVAEGLGPRDVVDPEVSDTPVTDALRAVDSASPHGKGKVILPATSIEQGEPLTAVDLAGKQLIGTAGPSPLDNAQLIFTDTSKPAINVDRSTHSWFTMRNVELDGIDKSDRTGTPAITGSSPVRFFNLQNVKVRGWSAKKGSSTPGIVNMSNWKIFSSTWTNFMTVESSGPGIYAEGDSGGLKFTIDNFYYWPKTEDAAIEANGSSLKLKVNQLNTDGYANRAVWLHPNWGNGAIRIDSINFEPKEGNPINVCEIGGKGLCQVGHIRYHNDLNEVVKCGYNHGRVEVGDIHSVGNNGSDYNLSNGRINLTDDSTAICRYYGPVSHINNQSGSELSYPWVTLDGVWKTSTGNGYTSGVDRRVQTPINQSYSLSNVTADRELHADDETIESVVDVLGTLISDLQAGGYIQ